MNVDNIKNFFIKHRTHMICLVVGVLLGFLVTYVAFSLCINISPNMYIDDKGKSDNTDDVTNVDSIDDKNENVNESYQDFIDKYKIYLSAKKVGDGVILGNYEQDDNVYNGKEDIEWVVLYKSNKNSMMLISKYILDCMSYDLDDSIITWHDSDVRKYLNDDFYEMAFNDTYKTFIMENDMTNNKNVNYKTDGGKETRDKVFLLSESQAKKYFSKNEKDGSNISRTAKPTEYAKGKGVATIVDKNVWHDGCSSYYLRTPGVDQTRVEVIEPNGAIYEYGELVGSTEVGIRPCIWVKY